MATSQVVWFGALGIRFKGPRLQDRKQKGMYTSFYQNHAPLAWTINLELLTYSHPLPAAPPRIIFDFGCIVLLGMRGLYVYGMLCFPS